MKPHEEIAKLQKENEQLTEQNTGLKKRIAELEKSKPKSKSRDMAEKALEMLKAGPVGVSDLKKLNDKYPADCAYYVRTLLKQDVKTVRTATGTLYMLPEHFQRYQETAAKAKESADEAKEEIQAPPISQAAEATNHVAV